MRRLVQQELAASPALTQTGGCQPTWCARQMRSRSCLCRNLATTSAPKVKETPRSFSPQPCTSLSGSDHSRSQSRPWSGTSVGLMIRRICSMDCKSGDRPGGHRGAGHLQAAFANQPLPPTSPPSPGFLGAYKGRTHHLLSLPSPCPFKEQTAPWRKC